jgi:hypothetical protein
VAARPSTPPVRMCRAAAAVAAAVELALPVAVALFTPAPLTFVPWVACMAAVPAVAEVVTLVACFTAAPASTAVTDGAAAMAAVTAAAVAALGARSAVSMAHAEPRSGAAADAGGAGVVLVAGRQEWSAPVRQPSAACSLVSERMLERV